MCPETVGCNLARMIPTVQGGKPQGRKGLLEFSEKKQERQQQLSEEVGDTEISPTFTTT